MAGALVIVSGGQDSTTCLYWAKQRYERVAAVTFDYGQRHKIEIDSAIAVCKKAGVESHEIVRLGDNILASSSPLIDKTQKVGKYLSADLLPGGVEPTFIPGRNILFLVLAANRAFALDVGTLVIGVCQEDFGGYWDCRSQFIRKMIPALSQGFLGSEYGIMIETPLMHLTKKESVELANSIPECLSALALTHTCYEGTFPPCGSCHACLLRARGFKEAGIDDPLITRSRGV